MVNVDFSHASLRNVDFTNSILSGMKAIGTNFQGSKLPKHGFEDAVLIRANFKDTIPVERDLIWIDRNFILDTIMSDGFIIEESFFGECDRDLAVRTQIL